MQTLSQTLQDHDRGLLKIIARLWGLELSNDPHSLAVERLSAAMLSGTPAIVETLPGGARRALELLLEYGGRISIEDLVRQFGPLREMGPGKRDRLEPWNEPASPLEMLWYRGLMARAFADSDEGPQEYGFVPDDLMERFPAVSSSEHGTLGREVTTPNNVIRSDSDAVDDATTLLAAHRRVREVDRGWLLDFLRQPESMDLVDSLLDEAGIIGNPKRIRDFLQAPAKVALEQLQETWRSAATWNDLSHTPDLINPTGDWPNDPQAGRRAALELLGTVPAETWWSVPSFVDAVFERDPGFMRPPGGFESWYLQSSTDGSNLHGFEAWDRVEGRYLNYLIIGPMLWLGLSEISKDGSVFRLAAPQGEKKVGKAKAWPDGRIRVARQADRTLRYQIARLCEWERMDEGAYHYRLTSNSLQNANDGGLTAIHAHKVLSEIPAPEGVLKAVGRWGMKGTEASLEQQTILQVKDPEIIKTLAAEPSTRRYLGEQLGPLSVIVDAHQWRKLKEAALKVGLLIGAPNEQ